MNATQQSTARHRAFRELEQRDIMGMFLRLNYQQIQDLKNRDVDSIRPIVEKQLRAYKQSLWLMGLLMPLLLGSFSLWLGLSYSLVVITLLFVFNIAFLIKTSVPRIVAFERALVLLDLAEAESELDSVSDAAVHAV